MVTAAIEGQLADVPYELDPIFNVYVPTECPNVSSELLKPRNVWQDKNAYDAKARELTSFLLKTLSALVIIFLLKSLMQDQRCNI